MKYTRYGEWVNRYIDIIKKVSIHYTVNLFIAMKNMVDFREIRIYSEGHN
jgi:hypothetical protein